MKNFFKGISVSQIIAGALAAVTSFLLSAKIGIAGSLIGVAVGSIVSAVASQIYQNVLNESGKRLQENLPQDDDTAQQDAVGAGSDDETRVIGSDARHHGQLTNPVAVQSFHGTPVLRMDGTSPRLAALARTEKIEPGPEQKDATKTLASGNVQGDTSAPGNGKNESDKTVVENGKDTIKSDATQILTPSASGETTAMPPVGQKQQGKSATGTSKKLKGGPGQSDGHIRVFDSSKQKRYKRLAIVVAVVSALVAVGITAGVISLVTKGEGTDHVVRNIVTNSTIKNPKQQQEDSGKTSTDGSEKTDRNTQGNNTTTNQNNSGSTSDSGTQSGSTSNGTGTSSNSGNSSSSNNSGNTTSGSTGGGTGSDSNSSGSGSTDSSNSGTNTGNGSTDSGSTNGSTSGGTGTGGNESGSTSGSQSGNGGTGTTPGTTK